MYRLRSDYACWFQFFLQTVGQKDFQWEYLVQAQNEWRQINQYLNDDYYPLVEWSREPGKWKAWQFFDPDTDSGYAQIMRPEGCEVSNMTIKLYGLDKDKTYQLTDFDGLISESKTGAELMENGIEINIPTDEYAMIILIKA